MNCKLSNKLEAVRIKPTEEVLDNFKYRNLNDEALMWDGDFNFKEMGLESEKVYVILENNNGKSVFSSEYVCNIWVLISLP
jgi:hypothetical protein